MKGDYTFRGMNPIIQKIYQTNRGYVFLIEVRGNFDTKETVLKHATKLNHF